MPIPAGYKQTPYGLWVRESDASGPYFIASDGTVTAMSSGSGRDAAVDDWEDRIIANGGTVSEATLDAADDFVVSTKATGVWALIRRFNPCAGNQLAASLVPLVKDVGSATDTNVNLVAGDYSEALGWQTDGATKYLDTGYIPTELTGSLSAYLRTAQTDAVFRDLMGTGIGSGDSYEVYHGSGLNTNATWGGTAIATAASNTPAGFWHSVRASATSLALYFNGASVGTDATNTVPVDATVSLYVMCARHVTFGPVNFLVSGSRVAGYVIDAGMTALQAADLYTAMQAFQTALGRNV
jgi:hypothetical protein